MSWRFNPPPGWPQQPPGWQPPAGWAPDPSWPPAPEGWAFWVPDGAGEYAPLPVLAMPPPPPKRARPLPWILAGAAALAALCCGAVVFGSLGGNKEDSPGGGGGGGVVTAKPEEKPEPGIGDPVRDGKFEFVVQKSECGESSVGSGALSKTAQGQYCLVTVSVKNIGDRAQTMADSNQKGRGSNGAEYSTDSQAGFYVNTDNPVWIEEINPGNQITGVLVFDVPKDVQLTGLELHDSAFSNGVDVSLN